METIKIFKGGFINKNQTLIPQINKKIEKIKLDLKNIFNNENSEFYGIPLLDKEGNKIILEKMIKKLDEEKTKITSDKNSIEEWLKANPESEEEKLYKMNEEKKTLPTTIENLMKKGKPFEKFERQLKVITENLSNKIIPTEEPIKYKDRNNKKEDMAKKTREINLIDGKINKIKTFIGKDNINRESIGKDLKAEYVKQIEENNTDEYKKDMIEKYNNVFNNIVPLYNYNEKFFSFLGNDILILQKSLFDVNFNFIEIYGSDSIVSKVFLLDEHFIISTIPSSELNDWKNKTVFKSKEIIHPFFHKGYELSYAICESQMLMSNKTKLIDILIYYKKYLGDVFENWFNTFGKIIEGEVIFNDKILIFNSFILVEKFDLYIYFYNYIMNKDITFETIFKNYKNFDITKEKENEIIQNILINKDNKNLIVLLFERMKTIIKNIDIEDEKFIYIFEYVMNEIKLEKDIQIDILNIYNFLYKDIVYSKYFKKIVASYNFLKINYLYNEVEKSFENTEKFMTNISQLNQFIKMKFSQIYKFLFIDLTQELYNYYLLNKVTTNNKFLIVLIFYFYFNNLQSNNILKNLTNLYSQFYKFNVGKDYDFNTLESGLSHKQLIQLSTKKGSSNKNLSKFYLKLFYPSGIGSLLKGYKMISYIGKLNIFQDPRNDINANKQTLAGRPFCGEISILNLLNFILWDKDTQKLNADYFPNTVNPEMKSFFIKNNKIDMFESKDIYTEFYQFFKDIPFELRDEESNPKIYSRARDYGDANLNCVYRYNVINKNKIVKGTELRLSYFNICRVLSYILKLEDLKDLKDSDLKLDFIQKNLNENTLKNILAKFNNPNKDKILQTYKFENKSTDSSEPISIYSTDVGVFQIKLVNSTFRFGAHSSESIDVDVDKSDFSSEPLEILLEGKKTFYDNKDGYINIPQAVYVAKMKGKEIYSEINFEKIDDDECVKFLKLLVEEENNNLPRDKIINIIDNGKIKSIDYLYENFDIYGTNLWSVVLRYFIKENNLDKTKEYIEKYMKIKHKRKLNFNFLKRFMDVITVENLKQFENYMEDGELNLISSISYPIFNTVKNLEMLEYISNKIDEEQYIRLYLKLNIEHDFDNLFKKYGILKIIQNSDYDYYSNKDTYIKLLDYIKIYFRVEANQKHLLFNLTPIFYDFYTKHIINFYFRNMKKDEDEDLENMQNVIFALLLKKTLLLKTPYLYMEDSIIANCLSNKKTFDRRDNYKFYSRNFKIINLIIEKNNEVYKKPTTYNFDKTVELFKTLIKEDFLNKLILLKIPKDDQMWQLAKNLKLDLLDNSIYKEKYIKYKNKYLALLKKNK